MLPLLIHTQILKMNIYSKFFSQMFNKNIQLKFDN